jgi:hypothetical protein
MRRFKLQYTQASVGREPEVIDQETVELPDIAAAKEHANRKLKASQVAALIPSGAAVGFLIIENGRVIYPQASAVL